MMNILIIDDEQHAIDVLTNHLKSYTDYKICGAAKTVKQAIRLTNEFQPNLVFLDIVLDTETGFDYLNTFLPDINFNVIFITAYNNYAVKAFEYSALHYLLKPIDTDKLHDAILRFKDKIVIEDNLQRLQSLEHNIKYPEGYKWIHIATMGKRHRINTKDVLYIKSDSNYTNFHLKDNSKITTSKTLKHYTELLEGSHFYKVHKSFLVNVELIKSYDKKRNKLILADNTAITVAARRRKEFIKSFFS